eukprot:scaffold84574_cov18-Phaeocystis_antarctica.AAC.1
MRVDPPKKDSRRLLPLSCPSPSSALDISRFAPPRSRRALQQSIASVTMVSKYGKDFTVPKNFPSVLKAFTRE